MSVQNPFEKEEKKLPSLLNVLTILTMVGCAIELIIGTMNLISGRKNLDKLEELQNSGQLDNAPEFMKKFAGPEAIENARLAYENRIPLFVIMVAGMALCLYGALQMRKLQKNGYFMWLIGELLPTVGSIVLIGVGFAGNAGWMLLFPLVFIILYTTQLKYLK
ncbi:hypothetical protein [Flavihumibacter fluvii]|uniref:hypothetical protein n=1 Tax=Flavihumibacter fluvii TaxID=2838157 RepID=UPI001BDF066C|nr:hypothetical protein [Flavihumibacter fluvii]ULQ50600.1 hypothetical protein KJS93_10960 [Flavihumibacter fluvii]